ncbi:MAG: hypothetical protein AVDCRST_MAG16-809, partial [uncultured Frankineae bacterium]
AAGQGRPPRSASTGPGTPSRSSTPRRSAGPPGGTHPSGRPRPGNRRSHGQEGPRLRPRTDVGDLRSRRLPQGTARRAARARRLDRGRRREGRPLRRLGAVAHLVADRPRRRGLPHADPAGALRRAAGQQQQPRARPPERGGLLHPRGRRLRDPRRPALRLEGGRPRLRAHRLGAPPLQPVRREGRRAGHQGEVHVDVHGPDPAGPQRPDRARGRVRPARGLVGHLDRGRARAQEDRDARGHHVGAHAARERPAPGEQGPHRPAPVQRRHLRAGDPGGQPLGQALEDGRRGRLRARGLGLVPALGGPGGDRGEVLRAHRQGADPPRDQAGRHALRAAEHRRPALRPRRQPAAPAGLAEPCLQAPGLRQGLLPRGRPGVHRRAELRPRLGL